MAVQALFFKGRVDGNCLGLLLTLKEDVRWHNIFSLEDLSLADGWDEALIISCLEIIYLFRFLSKAGVLFRIRLASLGNF